MLRDGGLADRELGLDDSSDGARRHLAIGEQFEDPAPHRIAQYVERVHVTKLKAKAYISQVLISERVDEQ
jgi:hypothetical protein